MTPRRRSSQDRLRNRAMQQITKVGCCGFPLARSKYYSHFSVVEVQQTFYQPPKTSAVKRWRDEAVSDFEFTLKAWQLITHEPSSPTYRRLKIKLTEQQKHEVGSFKWSETTRLAWEKTLEVATILAADKIIFQCPASFKPTVENKNDLRRFFSKIQRRNLRLIWEPRGQWLDEEVAELCKELDLVHCVDPFKKRSVTSGLFYFRLHGIGGYRHTYADAELNRLSEWVNRPGLTYVMFNNVNMLDDALRFKELLGQQVSW